jgi:hypothetical protein
MPSQQLSGFAGRFGSVPGNIAFSPSNLARSFDGTAISGFISACQLSGDNVVCFYTYDCWARMKMRWARMLLHNRPHLVSMLKES